MRVRIVTAVLLLLSALPIYGQPVWLDLGFRETHFPRAEYYTGFAMTRWDSSKDLSTSLEEVKSDARNNMSEAIIVYLSGQTEMVGQSMMLSSKEETKEFIRQDFTQHRTSSTSSVIISEDMNTYFDPSTSMLYAFVSVKRADLESYYRSQTDDLISRVKVDKQIAESMQDFGRIKEAKQKYEEAQLTIKSAFNYISLLTAVNPSTAQTGRKSEVLALYKQINESIASMDKGPSLHILDNYVLNGAEDDAFKSNPNLFARKLGQVLSEEGFLIDNKNDTDYELHLETSTSLRSRPINGVGLLSYYANVSGKLINCHTGKEVTSFSYFREPTFFAVGQTPEAAAGTAFRSEILVKTIKEIIIKAIE